MSNKSNPSRSYASLGRRVLNAALALAVMVLPIVAIESAQGQTFTLLHTFAGAPDGAAPLAGLIQDPAGNSYGTTQQGGITGGVCANSGLNGCGTVFKLDPAGNETVLYRFTGGADGEFPAGGLVRDAAGKLYGTTQYGGPVTATCGIGCGTIFKLDTTNTLTVLHSIGSRAGLAMDGAGKLYGSTTEGIFQLDPVTDTFTVLDSTAGSGATLALDAAGNIYGTTEFGGITGGVCGNSGCGTVFQLDTTHTYSVLYSFTGQGNDGLNPLGGVVLDAAGNLWGTTSSGGALDCTGGQHNAVGCGTVFKVSPAGGEISGFSLNGPDFPQAGLALDAAGIFYGTSKFDGSAEGLGELFKIGPDGIQSPLHIFTGLADGQSPLAGVVLDAAGNVYGTTPTGGPSSFGTVFKIDPTGPQTFPLTVVIFGSGTVTGSGVNCSSNCATWVGSGTAFTLTATPPAGSSFVGWVAPPCSGTGTCSVTVNAAQTVGATFDSDFTVSATALTPAAVSAGGSATSTINVAAGANGFFSAVALTCAVTPAPVLAPTCSISPGSVMPGTAATLTVSTTAPTSGALASNRASVLFFALCLPIIGWVATQVGFGSDRRTAKQKLVAATLACILFAGLVFQVACGSSSNTGSNGGGNKGTPAGTYTITVTGTYSTGSLVHTAPTTLTVQ
jgi:uncharacterized repeat protein (TIGR03803 family)